MTNEMRTAIEEIRVKENELASYGTTSSWITESANDDRCYEKQCEIDSLVRDFLRTFGVSYYSIRA